MNATDKTAYVLAVPLSHAGRERALEMNTQMTAVSGGILARLKADTATEHRAIESMLDLTGSWLTRPAYCRLIEAWLGYQRPVERRLKAIGGWADHGLDLAARSRAPLLEMDLRALEAAERRPCAECEKLPRLETRADGFGCLYVLEGSTLGGQIISRHLEQSLGITRDSGGLFFRGYGEETGLRWREFGAALTAFAADQGRHDEIVTAATATFQTLREWLRSQSMTAE
jgi:heme oxygenase